MIRKLIFSLLALISVVRVSAQEVYLQEIEQNSLTLKALREQMEAEQLANKTGIYLSNPEVEFNYLWGSPSTVGNRTNLAVTQEFDFPTLYKYRADRTKQLNENAELRYKSERIDILLQAKEILAQLTYLGALEKLYTTRFKSAEQLLESYKTIGERGAIGILEINKSELNYNTVSAELSQIKVNQDELRARLKQLNGDIEIVFTDTLFPESVLPSNFEEWYAQMEAISPMLQYVKGEVMANESQIKVERAATLPKLSAGYVSESVTGQDLRGFSVGVSIPLWENKNKIKRAKADLKVAQTIAEDSRITFYNTLRSLYQRALLLRTQVSSTLASLSSVQSEILLKRALDAGEISLLTYLQELDYYYNAQEESLMIQLNLELILAQLYATEL